MRVIIDDFITQLLQALNLLFAEIFNLLECHVFLQQLLPFAEPAVALQQFLLPVFYTAG